jgi:putative membrane protein
LTYIRTGLYFLIAGSTLGHFVHTTFWNILGTPLIVAGLVIALLGAVRFVRVGRAIAQSRKHIGNASIEFIRQVKGSDADD